MVDSFSFSSPIVWIGILIFIGLLGWIRWKLWRRRRFDLAKITLRDIDKMDGHEFEDYLYVLISALDYDHIYQTKKSRDYGADLIFEDQEGFRTVVQAKRYRDKMGLSAVQEVYTAKTYYGADRALIITSAEKISEPCMKLASATGVQIVDRLDLEDVIKAFKKGHFEEAWELLEEPPDPVKYTPMDSLEKPPERRGMIQAGEYFYKN
ncbi:restriction endonuclease [Alkalihalophilus lindianensis]|uniref:Restriction endonuclease n=1 Tax=Alkalihalophilus lindianensis TaxID=1630542 RepID=A0ABU3XG23_9BACI|nr:restriction endonuclease [Alkalihalophilus lindianensis]MDV2686339.1 restriction endonuclease [Alkalihalophilus lindianensis]